MVLAGYVVRRCVIECVVFHGQLENVHVVVVDARWIQCLDPPTFTRIASHAELGITGIVPAKEQKIFVPSLPVQVWRSYRYQTTQYP